MSWFGQSKRHSSAARKGQSFRRKVQRVVDGDTFRVRRSVQGSQTIRLAGVNAPGRNTVAGRKATNSLKGKIGGKNVTIRPVGRSYGRVVGKVYSNRRLLR